MNEEQTEGIRQPEVGLDAHRLGSWMLRFVAIYNVIAVVIAVAIARNWPLVHDAPLLHYVVFLMDHGRAPYREILDMNMPGTYMLEWGVMHILGGGSGGWWCWSVITGLVTILSCAWIAGETKRAAGIAAGAWIYLVQLRGGAMNLGQRDWIVAVLLLVAFGCIFESIRKQRPVWMAGFMCCCGLAASIKPPVVAIALLLLVLSCWQLPRRRARAVGWSFLGGLIPLAAILIFLAHWGVTHDFLATLRGLVPFYAGLHQESYGHLILKLVPVVEFPLVAAGLVLFWMRRWWRDWETIFLVAGILSGAALFIIQRKGWPYHLYPELAFLLLWVMYEVRNSLDRGKLQFRFATVILLFTVVWMVPETLYHISKSSKHSLDTVEHLESDLNSLGGAQLNGKVQCLDMTTGGCINTLYRMNLVQSTGFIYDYYLFSSQNNDVVTRLRRRFLEEISTRPPEVIVLSSHTWPADTFGYDQLANWPAFVQVLDKNYQLARIYPLANQAVVPVYRIYTHK
jgi:hypothetical protein